MTVLSIQCIEYSRTPNGTSPIGDGTMYLTGHKVFVDEAFVNEYFNAPFRYTVLKDKVVLLDEQMWERLKLPKLTLLSVVASEITDYKEIIFK